MLAAAALQVAQEASQASQVEVALLKNLLVGQHVVFPVLQVRQPVASHVAELQSPVHAVQVLLPK